MAVTDFGKGLSENHRGKTITKSLELSSIFICTFVLNEYKIEPFLITGELVNFALRKHVIVYFPFQFLFYVLKSFGKQNLSNVLYMGPNPENSL